MTGQKPSPNKATDVQKKVLFWLRRGKIGKTARELFATMRTMEAMETKGLVTRFEPPRSSLSPETMVEWRLTDFGYQVAEMCEAEKADRR